MLLSELDFDFPRELIAQEPVEPRDSCRLMVVDSGGGLRHRVFSDLPVLLRAGDLLVLNDTRVLPARVEGRRFTGGKVELLFLRPCAAAGGDDLEGGGGPYPHSWEVLARPSHRLRVGDEVGFAGGERVRLARSLDEGRWEVSSLGGEDILGLLDRYGVMPLPPYIERSLSDSEQYQTVYAAQPGSAAAPTAGLHFTLGLLDRLGAAGVRTAWVTLHVGLDTFQPIREQQVEEHRIHREHYSVGREALTAIRRARFEERRVVAVGTTSARVLETLAADGLLAAGDVEGSVTGSSELFIVPGHRFRAVDALITNLHLPRSSVLALVMAFAGVQTIRAAYAEAIARRYRFFSFGDAMLIERPDPEENPS